MISLTKNKELKGYKSLMSYPEVAHFVTTRHGGVSTGTYASFNCSPYTNDTCMNLVRNRHRLLQLMKWGNTRIILCRAATRCREHSD